jgi:hypothetical protein
MIERYEALIRVSIDVASDDTIPGRDTLDDAWEAACCMGRIVEGLVHITDELVQPGDNVISIEAESSLVDVRKIEF